MSFNTARFTLWPSNISNISNISTKRPASTFEQEVVPSSKRVTFGVPPVKEQFPSILDIQEQSPWITCKKYMNIDLEFGIDTFLVSYNKKMVTLGVIHDFKQDKLKIIKEILSSQHKNLVQVQKLFTFEQHLYVLSEYMDISLTRLIAYKRLSEIEIASIIKEVIT